MSDTEFTQSNDVQPSSDGEKLASLLNEISSRLMIPADAATAAGAVKPEKTEYIQMMVFRLGDQVFGLDILSVSEVMRSPNVTPVPGLPSWVWGVTNHHGEIISVVHLTEFLGIKSRRVKSDLDVMVAHAADQKIGLVVDEVESIYTTSVDHIASPSFRIDPAIVPYLSGAVERQGQFIRLLHGERLLLGQQMQQFS